MFPRLARRGPAYSDQAHTVSFGQGLERGWWVFLALTSYLRNFFVSQFRQMLLFSMSFASAFLLVHIVHVALIIPQEEMSRSDAGSVVAFMQDELIIGDRSIFQFPCDTMSGQDGMCLSFLSMRPDEAVSFLSESSVPNPTFGFHVWEFRSALIYASPKPRNGRQPLFFGRTPNCHAGSLT